MKTVPELHAGMYLIFVGTYAETKGLTGKFFKALREEPYVYVTNEGDEAEFSEVADGGESGWTDIEAMEPGANRLYFVLMGCQDGADYYVKIPAGVERWGVDEDTDVGHFDNELSPYYEPSPEYSFWLITDMYPAVNAKNNTGHALTPKIWFWGVKLDYSEVSKEEIPEGVIPATVTLGGIKTG